MTRTKACAISLVLPICVLGCRSREAYRADLQSRYDKLMSQYWADCYGLSLDRNNTARVAKCKAEEDKIRPIQQNLKKLSDASLDTAPQDKQ